MNSIKRIELFKQMNFITQHEAEETESLLSDLSALLKRDIREDDATQALITHLASCLHRQKQNDLVMAMPDEVLNQIKQLSNFDLLVLCLDLINQYFTIPLEEQGYFLLHLSQIEHKGEHNE